LRKTSAASFSAASEETIPPPGCTIFEGALCDAAEDASSANLTRRFARSAASIELGDAAGERLSGAAEDASAENMAQRLTRSADSVELASLELGGINGCDDDDERANRLDGTGGREPAIPAPAPPAWTACCWTAVRCIPGSDLRTTSAASFLAESEETILPPWRASFEGAPCGAANDASSANLTRRTVRSAASAISGGLKTCGAAGERLSGAAEDAPSANIAQRPTRRAASVELASIELGGIRGCDDDGERPNRLDEIAKGEPAIDETGSLNVATIPYLECQHLHVSLVNL